MNKIINYQKLLGASFTLGETYDDSKHPIIKYVLVLFIISLIISPGGQPGQFIFIILGYCLITIYYIVNSSRKLYEIPPVSRFYTLLNIYLFTLITIFSFSFILLIGYLTTYFSFDSIKLLNNFISYFKGIILSLFLFLIISSVYIPTFFIKSLGIRRLLILFQTILLKILLLIANNKFASYNVHPFLKRIGDLSSYSRILMIIMLTFIIITPISIFISYKLYRKKEILC